MECTIRVQKSKDGKHLKSELCRMLLGGVHGALWWMGSTPILSVALT